MIDLDKIGDKLLDWLQAAAAAVVAVSVVCLVLIALFVPSQAHGQTPCPSTPTCEPNSQPDRALCGVELRGRTQTGEWSAFWWKDGARWCSYSWAGLYKFSPTPRQIMQIIDAVKAAPGPAAIMQAVAQYSVLPVPGSQDEFEFRTLRYAACQALHASPPVSGLTLTGTCVAPTAPAAPTETWQAVGGAIFVASAGRLTGVTVRKAPVDALCDLAKARALVGAKTFGALATGPATEVTECTKR